MRPDSAGDRCEVVAEVARELLSARVTIRPARSDDLATLIEIERAAGEMFRSVGMDLVADDDPGSVGELQAYAEGGRAFVAVDASARSATSSSTSWTGPLISSRSASTLTAHGEASGRP